MAFLNIPRDGKIEYYIVIIKMIHRLTTTNMIHDYSKFNIYCIITFYKRNI